MLAARSFFDEALLAASVNVSLDLEILCVQQFLYITHPVVFYYLHVVFLFYYI